MDFKVDAAGNLQKDAFGVYETVDKLEEFEQDLHQHVHLENNILFKKAEAVLA